MYCAILRNEVASISFRMPRMRLILFGISAFSYWLCAPSAPDASCEVSAKNSEELRARP